MATRKAAGGYTPNIQISQGMDSKLNLPEDIIAIFDYFKYLETLLNPKYTFDDFKNKSHNERESMIRESKLEKLLK